MKSNRHYRYAVAGVHTVGLMRCQKCHKRILEGQFRYWLSRKGTAYLSEHRACCEEDPKWAEMDVAAQLEEAWAALPEGTIAWAVWMPYEKLPRQILLTKAAAERKLEEFPVAYKGAMLVPLRFKEEDED